MEVFSVATFTATLALIGAVIVIAALLSGLIERSGLPQVAVFLALGAILGPAGLGLLDVTLESPILRVVATLSLVLVLFTDAVALNITDVRRHGLLAFLVLGPGTLFSAALIAVAGGWLLELPPAPAAILGAALASTDPVLLRGLLRSRSLPEAVRLPLRLESGLNDAAVLPIVLIAMLFLAPDSPHEDSEWVRMGLSLFLLGPGAGVTVGLLAIATLDLVRRQIGVRRDYESLYSLGVVFGAYAAAEALHGSGFLAAFTAGLTIAALDVELCDCFLEYGETTAEMALLFTFILFGASLIWSGFQVLDGTTFAFAVAVLLVRPIAFLISLAGTRLDMRGRLLIAWFGPRGLSSLLLVLLPVFAGLPGAERLFALTCLVVLLSVVVHGGSLMLLHRRRQRGQSSAPDAEMSDLASPSATPGPTAPQLTDATRTPEVLLEEDEIISIKEMQRLRRAGVPVVVIDARSKRAYEVSDGQAQGALRLAPDNPLRYATELKIPRDAWLAIYCECPNDEGSHTVAERLRRAGWPRARALKGGWEAWQAHGMPVESRSSASVLRMHQTRP